MKIWNIGIIGAGLIADFHAKAIQSLDNAKLTGICGTNQEKAQKLANEYSCKKFNNYSEMLNSSEIDVVTIATPSGAHMEPAVEAARLGKHVICEKPLEITLERIDKMIDAHNKAGTSLGGIFNFRYDETTEVIKKALDAGRLGTITFAAIYVPWWRSNDYYKGWHGTWELDGGGAMMNQSIHMVDLLQHIVGPINSLAAFTSKLGHPQIETEDTATCTVQFKNKALGIIYGTTASYPGRFRRMEITGTKGTIVLADNSLEVWQFDKMDEKDEQIINNYGKISGGGGVADPAAISYLGNKKNIAAFLQSLDEKRTFEINGQEARKAVEIILNMYRSATDQVVIKM